MVKDFTSTPTNTVGSHQPVPWPSFFRTEKVLLCPGCRFIMLAQATTQLAEANCKSTIGHCKRSQKQSWSTANCRGQVSGQSASFCGSHINRILQSLRHYHSPKPRPRQIRGWELQGLHVHIAPKETPGRPILERPHLPRPLGSCTGPLYNITLVRALCNEEPVLWPLRLSCC
jgi:hypothetical protein